MGKNFNIGEVITSRLAELENSGELKTRIEAEIDKLIQTSILNTISSWECQKIISDNLGSKISKSLKDFDFSTYHESVIKTVREIVASHHNSDLAEKITNEIKAHLTFNRKSVKMSEIIKGLHEKYSDVEFENKCTVRIGDRRYSQQTVSFAQDSDYDSNYQSCIIDFIDQDRKENSQRITGLVISGMNYDKGLIKINHLYDIEKLLVQIFYNQTPIIMDIDFDSIESELENLSCEDE